MLYPVCSPLILTRLSVAPLHRVFPLPLRNRQASRFINRCFPPSFASGDPRFEYSREREYLYPLCIISRGIIAGWIRYAPFQCPRVLSSTESQRFPFIPLVSLYNSSTDDALSLAFFVPRSVGKQIFPKREAASLRRDFVVFH